MNTYPQKEYPDLYNEILKDYHYRFPKFSPIPYPNVKPININWKEKNDK